jgi:hypothetical protein
MMMCIASYEWGGVLFAFDADRKFLASLTAFIANT